MSYIWAAACKFSCLLGATLLITCAAGTVLGQSGGPGVGPPPVINPRAEDRARQIAEGRLRSAELDAAAESENQKHIQEVIVHMKEDFTRIQVLRNDIARNLVAHQPLDYALISEQTGEIHKRASRLNVFMLARSSDSEEQSEPPDFKDEEMVGALVKLCKLVDTFTENPALKNVATLDVKTMDKMKEEKAQADKDLLAIIKLSELVKKTSDNLRGSH